MKNNNCSIIRDILPLYIENIISKDTKQFVEEHLSHCEECKSYFEVLQEDIPFEKNCLENDTGIEVIKMVESNISKKRWLTGIISAVVSAIIVILIFAYLTTPEYTPYSEIDDIISIKDNNGFVTLSFTGEYELYEIEDGIYNINIYNTLWNKLFNVNKKQNIIVNPNREKVNTIYYVSNDGQEDNVIYGLDPFENGKVISLPRLVLNYYFIIAILLFIISGIFFMIFRKKEKAKGIIVKIFFIPTSYIISHIMIKGFNATSYSAVRDFYLILLLTIPIYFLFYIIHKKKYLKS